MIILGLALENLTDLLFMVNAFDRAQHILSAVGSKVSTMRLQNIAAMAKDDILPLMEHLYVLKNLKNGIMGRYVENCLS
jgi:hypothetical protein